MREKRCATRGLVSGPRIEERIRVRKRTTPIARAEHHPVTLYLSGGLSFIPPTRVGNLQVTAIQVVLRVYRHLRLEEMAAKQQSETTLRWVVIYKHHLHQ